ncbi:hypothetical protein QOT17_009980 [Balamuthia mandrillaris]
MASRRLSGWTLSIPSATTNPDYTVYNIFISDGVSSWAVPKRFSALHDFKSMMEEKYPRKRFPPFPPKKLFGSNDPDTVEERRRELEGFLKGLLADSGFHCKYMLRFLDPHHQSNQESSMDRATYSHLLAMQQAEEEERAKQESYEQYRQDKYKEGEAQQESDYEEADSYNFLLPPLVLNPREEGLPDAITLANGETCYLAALLDDMRTNVLYLHHLRQRLDRCSGDSARLGILAEQRQKLSSTCAAVRREIDLILPSSSISSTPSSLLGKVEQLRWEKEQLQQRTHRRRPNPEIRSLRGAATAMKKLHTWLLRAREQMSIALQWAESAEESILLSVSGEEEGGSSGKEEEHHEQELNVADHNTCLVDLDYNSNNVNTSAFLPPPAYYHYMPPPMYTSPYPPPAYVPSPPPSSFSSTSSSSDVPPSTSQLQQQPTFVHAPFYPAQHPMMLMVPSQTAYPPTATNVELPLSSSSASSSSFTLSSPAILPASLLPPPYTNVTPTSSSPTLPDPSLQPNTDSAIITLPQDINHSSPQQPQQQVSASSSSFSEPLFPQPKHQQDDLGQALRSLEAEAEQLVLEAIRQQQEEADSSSSSAASSSSASLQVEGQVRLFKEKVRQLQLSVRARFSSTEEARLVHQRIDEIASYLNDNLNFLQSLRNGQTASLSPQDQLCVFEDQVFRLLHDANLLEERSKAQNSNEERNHEAEVAQLHRRIVALMKQMVAYCSMLQKQTQQQQQQRRGDDDGGRGWLMDRLEDLQENLVDFEHNFCTKFHVQKSLGDKARAIFTERKLKEAILLHEAAASDMFEL